MAGGKREQGCDMDIDVFDLERGIERVHCLLALKVSDVSSPLG
jgi:hypothetical protein